MVDSQAMDTVKKMSSSYPKDDMKRLEKEVSCCRRWLLPNQIIVRV